MKKWVIIENAKGEKKRFIKATKEGKYRVKNYETELTFANYGYIENTLAGDGDELDVFHFGRKLKPFERVRLKPKYIVITTENNERDDKVLSGKVTKAGLAKVIDNLCSNQNRIVLRIGGRKEAKAEIKKAIKEAK